jgi:hypothetical protein
MAYNRAHFESREKRLARMKRGSPVEVIETLLNSIADFFNNEISITPQNYQTSLLFLGIDASISTISEALFSLNGVKGLKKFLETFMDGNETDKKFSLIADVLHGWRNVIAHQWIGSIGHQIKYDYGMSQGWKREEDVVVINPKIYCECYLAAFKAGGKLWKWERVLSEVEQEWAKLKIVEKYEKR